MKNKGVFELTLVVLQNPLRSSSSLYPRNRREKGSAPLWAFSLFAEIWRERFWTVENLRKVSATSQTWADPRVGHEYRHRRRWAPSAWGVLFPLPDISSPEVSYFSLALDFFPNHFPLLPRSWRCRRLRLESRWRCRSSRFGRSYGALYSGWDSETDWLHDVIKRRHFSPSENGSTCSFLSPSFKPKCRSMKLIFRRSSTSFQMHAN